MLILPTSISCCYCSAVHPCMFVNSIVVLATCVVVPGLNGSYVSPITLMTNCDRPPWLFTALFIALPEGVFLCAFAWACMHKIEWYNPDRRWRQEAAAICSCAYNYLSAEIVDHCSMFLKAANPSHFLQASQIRLCETAGVQLSELWHTTQTRTHTNTLRACVSCAHEVWFSVFFLIQDMVSVNLIEIHFTSTLLLCVLITPITQPSALPVPRRLDALCSKFLHFVVKYQVLNL